MDFISVFQHKPSHRLHRVRTPAIFKTASVTIETPDLRDDLDGFERSYGRIIIYQV